MENASAQSLAHPYVEALLKQARESWGQIHAHRLENLRKQAKELLEQFRGGDASAIERFAAHHPNYPKDSIRLADAQSVIAREKGFSSWPKMKASLGQVLLSDEVERIHRKMRADGKEHLAPLITEESLKRAILAGIQSYEAAPIDHGKREGGWDYWQSVIKPLLLEIVRSGIWCEKGIVDICYEQKDEVGVSYEGLGASLEFLTPGAKYPGFSHAIVDLWYGRFNA